MQKLSLLTLSIILIFSCEDNSNQIQGTVPTLTHQSIIGKWYQVESKFFIPSFKDGTFDFLADSTFRAYDSFPVNFGNKGSWSFDESKQKLKIIYPPLILGLDKEDTIYWTFTKQVVDTFYIDKELVSNDSSYFSTIRYHR